MFKKSKKFLTATVAVALLFTMMTIVSAWTAVEPPPYDLEYARSCSEVLPFLVQSGDFNATKTGMYNVKYDVPDGGYMAVDDENPARLDFYDDESNLIFSVWLSRNEDGKLYINAWESYGIDVHYVITKGGSDFFVYEYDGTMDEDCSLMNPKTGTDFQNMTDLSNFSFYWTPKPEETTTEAEETTTEAEETTTEAEETTTEAEETTTEAEETTTEAEETTELIVLTDETVPLGEATTDATTEIAVEAATEAATQTTTEVLQITDDEIPQTGQSGNSVIIGSTLLALAASLIYILRRKNSFNE